MATVLLVLLASLPSFAANRLGVGYDSERGIELESPIEVLSLTYGSSEASLSFNFSYNSKEKTKEILLDANAAIGTPILGAELSGQLEIVEEEIERYLSCEMVIESFQPVTFDEVRRKPELGEGRVLWQQSEFTEKYGDKILWSLKSGGYLKITVVSKYVKDLDQRNINLQAKLRLLLTKIKIGEINSNVLDGNDDFVFSIFIEQKGGLETELAELRRNNYQDSWGKLSDRENILSNVFAYAFKSYPAQIEVNPGGWHEHYIDYDSPEFFYLWEKNQRY